MILKCVKCGSLYRADGEPREAAACSCSAETTILTDAGEAETARWDGHDDSTQSFSPSLAQTQSVLSHLGLQSRLPPVHAEAAQEKYEYLQPLGAGGMGEVVRAWDRDLHRFVAAKRLRSKPASRDTLLRFVKEAQITGRLEHPHIVPVHDLGVDSEGRLYFSLKLIEGESLKSILARRKAGEELSPGVRYRDVYTPLRMIEVFISVCQAMAYAHSKGVIHRDLKPENIMLGRYGETLVVDWGIAKVVDDTISDTDDTIPLAALDAPSPEASMEGQVSGTPAYMSPEQAQGNVNRLDARSDVYALGAVLYSIIAGRPPYEGSSGLEILRAVRQGPPRPLTTGTVGFHPIPRELKAICRRAMAREPEERYASVEELRDDLQAYLEDRPVRACPDGAWGRFRKWLRRNRQQAQSVSITAVTAIALLSGGYYGYREWRIRDLLRSAEQELAVFQADRPAIVRMRDSDSTRGYDALNRVLLDLQRALDLAPGRRSIQSLLAQTYMEEWRLAMAKENFALAETAKGEVLRYEGGEPNRYSDELNGSAVVALEPDPPDARLFLFKFAPVETQAAGGDLESRLVPVPYDLGAQDIVAAGLKSEQQRAQSGPAVLPNAHTIFNLEPSGKSLVPAAKLQDLHLPPGSYLVLARSQNREDTRVPLWVPRSGRVEQTIHLPFPDELPAGFFYVAGGEARIGGNSANALPEQSARVWPFLIFHDEISMGDYSEFLQDLVKSGRRKEAEARSPRDFGKKMAVLGKEGSLSGINTAHPKWFLASAVRGVSFNDVQAYIQWRSNRDGLPYRLPTEIEWESACRGADGRRFSWGNRFSRSFAFILQGYNDMGGDRQWKWEDFKDESPWGVHDLAGGVAEWTSSTYNPAAMPGSAEYGQFAIRGNAWSLPPVGLECAFRTSGQPDYFHPTIGFRLALDYPVVKKAESPK